MESIGPNTRPIMMLLLFWLWVLLFGPSVYGSPLELQMLEMMLREAEGYPSNGRDQRDITVLPAPSIECDEKDLSLMQAASMDCDESGSQEQFSHIFDDESEECLEFLEPCEPSFEKGLPVDHPCFVRLLLLRTPLLKEDPCANFSLAAETTKTTKKPKRKCNPKGNRAKVSPSQNHGEKNSTVESTTCSPMFMADEPNNSSTSSPLPETTPKRLKLRKLVPKNRKLKQNSTSTTTPSTIQTTVDPTEVQPDSKIIYIRKDAPKNMRLKPTSTTSTTSTTTTTTSTTAETTTAEEATTTEEPLTTEDPSTTTTEQDTTTTEYSTTPYSTTPYRTTSKTTTSTTTTERPLTDNQLKRLRAAQLRRRNRKGYEKGTPKVPDPPKIKIDGATQPSEVIHVILPTDAHEMRLKPEEDCTTTVMPTTTSTSEPETTTEDSCEDEVETTKLPEFPESEDAEGEASDQSESKGGDSMEEPCEDTEEQDTNLCPQFMPAQGQSNSQRRPPTPFRYRKPVKNYVEPILYEGNIAKPLHRPTRIRPPQKDYFISNKQIVPRPRPKYRKRLPHSIYMNNIVRGLDCVDEVDRHPSRDHQTQSQRYWDLRRVGPGQRIPNPQRNQGSFAPVSARRPFSYPGSTEEGSDESQYLREIESEPNSEQFRYPQHEEEAVLHEERPMPQQAMPTPSMDPCQVEHDHALFGEKIEHPGDYPQTQASSHFFT